MICSPTLDDAFVCFDDHVLVDLVLLNGRGGQPQTETDLATELAQSTQRYGLSKEREKSNDNMKKTRSRIFYIPTQN